MEDIIYSDLQLRELFHIEFLRALGRKLKAGSYALKGGVNLRLFFKSLRYSEDMDLDTVGVGVSELKDIVMKILEPRSFRESFYTFGIRDVVPPDIKMAKQTRTTQRFKVHLITTAGVDLFTKIEFSRRGFMGKVIVESIPAVILRNYKASPLIIAHYDVQSAVMQKIKALASRTVVQARDIFDLYILSSQINDNTLKESKLLTHTAIARAYERVFEVDFAMFKDAVVSYLSGEDQNIYSDAAYWDEIKLKTSCFIEELIK